MSTGDKLGGSEASASGPLMNAIAADKSPVADANAWTAYEETVFIHHMQRALEDDFDASKVHSLLPGKTIGEIKEKWKEFMSSLLQHESRRKRNQDETENENEPTNLQQNNSTGKIMLTKKMHPLQKRQRTENHRKWTQDDLERLMEIMEGYATTTPKWDIVALSFPGKNPVDCLAQWQGMSIPHQVKGKGSWTVVEDTILRAKCRQFGHKVPMYFL